MPAWTEDGLLSAWSALTVREEDEEWRSVRLTNLGGIDVEVARHFPGSYEAILFCVPASIKMNLESLPKGRGFEVSVVLDQNVFPGRQVVALSRESEGNPDIFVTVVVDILRLVDELGASNTNELVSRLLGRVREWQLFMERSNKLLSADRQVGLLGELIMLQKLVRSELGASALRCWSGPLHSAVDFRVETVGIEVKSTIRRGAFVCNISNVEQLDNDCEPMFVCGIRFEEHDVGVSLTSMITDLRSIFSGQGTRRFFDGLLMAVGYFDANAHHYDRKLRPVDMRVFEVTSEFPHLTRSEMPPAIRTASYTLDLDAIASGASSLQQLFTFLGLTLHEP